MTENNNTYRIHTNIREDNFLNVNLNQDIEQLEILSLKIDVDNFYKTHTSDYGCLVGRVLANQGVGIPNVKISVFIPVEQADLENPIYRYLYPYTSVKTKNSDGIRYNLLPDSVDNRCHQDIGTFPNKRLVLDDDNIVEVFDKYFKYTTVTNAAGDYMLFGLPVGNNIIHSELDLSDIGMLSQKPRDLYYKGYNKTQFENSSQFKKDTNLDYLTQVIVQDNPVQVYPFWGDDETEGYEGVDRQVKITRSDIDINYKFEPTCIFIGSLVADDKSNGFSKKCIPTERSGKMDRLTTGAGTIEMIRKTPDNEVESFSIQGNDLIDGNGTWCYQIPMNLDYVKTDEYGNLVAAENEVTGIPTRARVRFRISLADYESDSAEAHLPKVLVPNNPTKEELSEEITIPISGIKIPQGPDYNFGTYTREESFRDLFWNNVYTVKQYIPRLQNIIVDGPHIDRSKKFSGIKTVNVNGNNNPIPYNNIRVQLTFLFIFQCIIFKALIIIVKILNTLIWVAQKIVDTFSCGDSCKCGETKLAYITLDGSMCPTMEGVQMAIGAVSHSDASLPDSAKKLVDNTISKQYKASGEASSTYGSAGGNAQTDKTALIDPKSSEKKYQNGEYTDNDYSKNSNIKDTVVPDQEAKLESLESRGALVSARGEYFVKCVELQFAMEYEVIQFDFYNDWINGLIYLPRWFAELKRRKRVDRVVACNEGFTRTREIAQQCAVGYLDNRTFWESATTAATCGNKCHKKTGRRYAVALKNNGGIIQTFKNNIDDKKLYYLRPSLIINKRAYENGIYSDYVIAGKNIKIKANLFATDIVLLGSVSDCNTYGIPTADGYPSSTFVMPPPTGQLLSDSDEMNMTFKLDDEYPGIWKDEYGLDHFVMQNKRSPHWSAPGEEIEVSGIDWGYNPFKIDDDVDDTTKIRNQVAGHFLEIGCTSSATTPKSCLNLTRICELGAEMAQSHFLTIGGDDGVFFATRGIITPKEVIGEDMRIKFATLNSNKLSVVTDENNYLRYKLYGYTPNPFDGAFKDYFHSGDTGYPGGEWDKKFIDDDVKDVSSPSYFAFRFGEFKPSSSGTKDGISYSEHSLVVDKFSDTKSKHWTHRIPVYENSFYFYFGLKNGSTAIDRLYSEYFSECTTNNETEEGSIY